MKKLILSVSTACAMTALANHAQVWTQENLYYAIGPRTTIGVSQENRIGVTEWANGKKHIDEIHIAPSIDYLIQDWLSVGVNYRHVLSRDGTDVRYKDDYRPGIDVAFKRRYGDFLLLNRSRFICRKPEGEQEYFRYRNLSRVAYLIGDIAPYVSYEWYYDEGSKDRQYRKNDRFSQQWITLGCEWKISKAIKATTYYMLTENKNRASHDWYPGHVIGIGITLAF